jgi:hypothetical protein
MSTDQQAATAAATPDRGRPLLVALLILLGAGVATLWPLFVEDVSSNASAR